MTSSGVLGPENFPPWVRPYLPPPPSPEVLRHIHDTRGPSILAGMIVMSGCAIAAVIARLYARRARKLPFQADDYLMIPALIFTLGLCIINIAAVPYGMGRHVWVVPYANDLAMLKMAFGLGPIYVLSQSTIKMSILLLYRRIFTTLNRSFKILLYSLMACVLAWAIAIFVYAFLSCQPVAFSWDKSVPGGFCYSNKGVIVGILLSALADFAILVLPCLVLWKLQMTTGRKVSLTVLFLMGIFAFLVSIVRIPVTSTQGPDWTWQDSQLWVWIAVESVVGVLCGCFPVIAPALGDHFSKKRLSTTRAGRFFKRLLTTNRSSQPSQADAPQPSEQLIQWPSRKDKASRHDSDNTISSEALSIPRTAGSQTAKESYESLGGRMHLHAVLEEDEFGVSPFPSYMRDEEKALPKHIESVHISK